MFKTDREQQTLTGHYATYVLHRTRETSVDGKLVIQSNMRLRKKLPDRAWTPYNIPFDTIPMAILKAKSIF